MKYVFAILIMISPLVLPAQDDLKPLKIGDSVPDLVLPALMNDPLPAATLYRYSGGLLILDFWATWCSSCLYSLPRLEDLRERYGGQLQVLMVNAATTGDDEGEIAAFLKRRRKKDGSRYTLPVVAGDTVLSRLFLHKLLPHYIWIYKNKVVAITGSEALTEENVETALRGDPLKVAVKQDIFDFDPKRPLFQEGNGGRGETVRYRSLIARHAEGLNAAAGLHADSAGGTTRLYLLNRSLLQLYKYAWKVSLPSSRILLEVDDPARLTREGDWSGWKEQHTWCYELTLPLAHSDQALHWMQQDLGRYFGYRAAYEKRTLWCLVIQDAPAGRDPGGKKRTGRPPKTPKEGEAAARYRSAADLARVLSHSLQRPVVSESARAQPLELLREVHLDPQRLQEALRRYGLRLVEGERTVDVFVIREPCPRAAGD